MLEAKDPKRYEIEVKTFTAKPSMSTGASVLPFVLPVILSGDAYTGSVSINNTGNAGIIPTMVKIYGECSGPIIRNSTRGEYVGFTSDVSLSQTEYLLIDFKKGTVYKYSENNNGNGENVLQYLLSGSVFWSLNKGNNSIIYTANVMKVSSKAEITLTLTM